MTAVAWNWLLTIAGTAASIVGVYWSWKAWVQAADAASAARDASEAVRKRNLAQDTLRIAGDAKEFLAAVQQDHTGSALTTANSLLHALSILRKRSVADSADVDTLNTCLGRIMAVAIRLNVDGIPLDPFRREDLLIDCHEIHKTICELAGRFEQLSEGAKP